MLGLLGLLGIAALGSVAFGDLFSGTTDQDNDEGLGESPADEGLEGNRISGTNLDDVLMGTYEHDSIYGLGGNDTIFGGLGDDTVNGAAGDDVIYGGLGDDELVGGIGADYLEGGAGVNTLIGGAGNDTLSGGISFHPLLNDGGVDELVGGRGDDTFIMQDGDRSFGGEGSDEFRFASSSTSNNEILDFVPGQDVITIAVASGDQTGDISVEENDAGDAILFLGDQQIGTVLGAAGTISADDIYFVGSDGEILGDSGDDLLRGGEGDDGILGLSGDDTIYGGGGGDSIHGGEGVDHIYGNDGDDLLYVGAGDHAYGGSGFDQFTVLNDATGAVIEDFQSGTDIVNIQYYSAEGTLPTPDLTLRDTESGDTIVSLDGSDVLRIVGGGGSFSLADISLEDTIEEPSWWSRI